MEHKLINNGQYLLVVSDDEIKYKEWYIDDANQVRQCVVLDTDYWKTRKDYKKIISHLPLNNSPILQNVDLLPPLEQEDDVEKLAREFYPNPYVVDMGIDITFAFRDGFQDGFLKAKEKYKYTEEDMTNCVKHILTELNTHNEVDKPINFVWIDSFNRFIQSLSKPRLPVAFNTKELINSNLNGKNIMSEYYTKNSQGQNVWVGNYIF